jgi:hypothetical protein
MKTAIQSRDGRSSQEGHNNGGSDREGHGSDRSSCGGDEEGVGRRGRVQPDRACAAPDLVGRALTSVTGKAQKVVGACGGPR